MHLSSCSSELSPKLKVWATCFGVPLQVQLTLKFVDSVGYVVWIFKCLLPKSEKEPENN